MAKIDRDEDLFEEEKKVIRSAMADLENIAYQDSALLDRYKWFIGRYSKLLSLTRKIFRISDTQGRSLYRHQNEIQNLLDNANQGFLTFGSDLKVNRQYSAQCVQIFGRKIAGISIIELIQRWEGIDIASWEHVFCDAFVIATKKNQQALQRLSSIIRVGEKDIRVECKLISQDQDGFEEKVIMMILTDITEKRKSEEHIRYISYHDKLTSLYNRAYIEMVLPDLERKEAFPLSVIVVDMNGLKLVNDVFGHMQGDRLLVAMAQVMIAICRSTDVIIRWGGDEFIILLPKTDRNICEKVCERIHIACKEAQSNPICLSASIGAATKESLVTTFEELFVQAENRMYSHKLENRQQFRQNIMTEMEDKLYHQCFENIEHGERVLNMSLGFASFLGMNLDNIELKLLNQLAIFHDIGKVAIPTEILGKAGRLDPREWKIVKSHSDIGYRMVQSIGDLPLAEVVLTLHERWDGNGYPHGLVGQKIPLLARLFALVDVYDILTHERPYRMAMDKEVALREISLGRGSQFDPELTDGFLEYMSKK